MGNKDGVVDPPPTFSSPGRSDLQEKSAFFISNEHFGDHSKLNFHDDKREDDCKGIDTRRQLRTLCQHDGLVYPANDDL